MSPREVGRRPDRVSRARLVGSDRGFGTRAARLLATSRAMRFKTMFNGYSLAFSPFLEGRLAVTTSQNFGIIGNGQQYVLDTAPGGGLVEIARFETADGLYDCCWSEENENILVSASGDGSVKVYDISAPPQMNPLRSLEEHTHEAYSVHWNQVRRDVFLSASWDDTVKLWTLNGPPNSIRTFAEHAYCVYAAVWSPQHADVFATASGDCTLKVWDVRQPHSTLTIPAHEYEILTCDWNKYNDCVIATGSVDRSVKLWDVRNPSRELAVMPGHQYAVRQVRCSPHADNIVYSASYDMTVAMWDWKVASGGAGDPLLRRWAHHTEFAVGLDCSVLREGLLGSCGWDEMVYVWPASGDALTF